MRKLAREVVIFMLLTPPVFFAGSFGYLYYDAHRSARQPGGNDPWAVVSQTPTAPVDDPWAVVSITPNPAQPTESSHPKSGDPWAVVSQTPVPPASGSSPRAAVGPAQPADALDWAAITEKANGGTVQTAVPETPISEVLLASLIVGLYGFPAGFGFWIFYRAIRFAIKG